MNKTLVAASGEHYVAYKLSCFGYLAAFVRQGSPSTDLLASSLDGQRAVAIQVKTTSWAQRTSGRGVNKAASRLEFPLGHNAVDRSSAKLIFCFVDLRGNNPDLPPDIYVVPAALIHKEYFGQNIRQQSYFRHHRSIDHMAPFKNNWNPIHEVLRDGGTP